MIGWKNMSCLPNPEGYGRGVSDLTIGEVGTLLATIINADPEDIQGFITIVIRTCPDCGQHFRFQINKSMDDEGAIELLVQSINQMLRASHADD
jgi:hypothetical protein